MDLSSFLALHRAVHGPGQQTQADGQDGQTDAAGEELVHRQVVIGAEDLGNEALAGAALTKAHTRPGALLDGVQGVIPQPDGLHDLLPGHLFAAADDIAFLFHAFQTSSFARRRFSPKGPWRSRSSRPWISARRPS